MAEIAERVIGERLQFRPRLRRNQAAHALEDRVPGFLQRRLQFRALPAMHVAQPMVAAHEHVGKQILDALDVVVEVREQPLEILRDCVVALDQFDGCARCLKI